MQVYDYACVRVALRENITDILVDYPKGIHVNELSKIVNIDAKKLARLLRVLATRGCYTEGWSCRLFAQGSNSSPTDPHFQWTLTPLQTTASL